MCIYTLKICTLQKRKTESVFMEQTLAVNACVLLLTRIYKVKSCLHISTFKISKVINIAGHNLKRRRENGMETFVLTDHVQRYPICLTLSGFIHTQNDGQFALARSTHCYYITFLCRGNAPKLFQAKTDFD
jgi:hypothetical protein